MDSYQSPKIKHNGDTNDREFSKLAIHLIKVMAYEASVERIFSQKRLFSTGIPHLLK